MIINYLDIIIDLTRKETNQSLSATEKRRLDKLIEWFNFDIEKTKDEM